MTIQKEITRKNNERKILQAAEQIFAQYGFKGATTDQIAKKAGLPKANIHYYFKTKALLYRILLEGILDEWLKAADAFDQYQQPKKAITKYVEAKMDFSRHKPYASKVWANEVIHGAEVASEFMETHMKKWLDEHVKLVDSWISEKKISKVDPTALFYMIWSTTQHYADFDRQIVLLNGGSNFSDEEYQEKVRSVTALILGSVGLG